ncbi:SWIM zinc finger family protein [Aureispira sp. CCB-E]|uniref:SWIM zinc finger family protein n=1 Tax=Aureispira sp. CCB-E TaxID=3051121 RepID=UPI0028695736|nr:SWIM zinc finger family protein [Aureispira sp. CCB-E]WMX12518.1 SWIM zinc finger family protein [Aureispira sp. CCB-E]
MQWTDEKIAALSPNDSTERRGRTLANSTKWNYIATNYEAIWGECKGSGSQPYIVQINLSGPKYKCSCPVRKPPCKHVLGLFFLFAQSSALFKYQAPPEAIQNWLSKQSSNSVASHSKTIAPTLKTEEALQQAKAAKEKRWEQRVQLMASGMDELELWLTDLIRQGIANTAIQKVSFWNQVAAKMVDAKLPRISTYLKETHQLIQKNQNWSEIVLARLGELYLWTESFKKRSLLTPELQEELYLSLGKIVKKADVLEQNPSIKDLWFVVGKKEGVDIEGRSFRKIWLQGQKTKQHALILDYAFGNIGYEQQYIVGDLLDGALTYYSKAYPQRAIFESFESAQIYESPNATSYKDFNAVLTQYGEAIVQNPWLFSFPVVLSQLRAFMNDKKELLIKDINDHIIPLSTLKEEVVWKILAISGGKSICLFGEWDGLHFEPLSMLTDNGTISFS